MKSILTKIGTFFITLGNKLSNSNNTIKLIRTDYNPNGRFYTYIINNPELDSHKDISHNIYNLLMNNKRFLAFGNYKVIIVSALINGGEFSFHHNILITNNTTFDEYYNKVKDYIIQNYEYGYPVDVIPNLKLRVWNMDEYRNKHIIMTRTAKGLDKFEVMQKRSYHSTPTINKSIKPLRNNIITDSCELFATMDIETMEYSNNQIPVSISTSDKNGNQLFIINSNQALQNINLAVDKLWDDYFKFIIDNSDLTIFVHNLGSFDGLFLYKALLNSKMFKPTDIQTIIDDKNKFIQITLNHNGKIITWKDSYRIFPVSLDNLCKVFAVEGKSTKYLPEFNSFELFNNKELLIQFKEYSLQDSKALYEALYLAQVIYLTDYNIDITSILSTSTLSLKIFRKMFQEVDIPILKGQDDSFVRKAYFGGGTDYYKAYATNLHYYDVNSLYPFAMINYLPLEPIKWYNDMIYIKLEDVFGYFEVEVESPKDIFKPLLPYKHNNRTIYPIGTWIGTYFSEELKALTPYGYKFKLLNGMEYSKAKIFSPYIDHFYNKKKNSSGPAKFIAKMHLNQLYGIFGRRQDLIQTINIYNTDLPKYLNTKIVKTIIEINSEISVLLIHSNIDPSILSELNINLETNINSNYVSVKSNVAIAAAVTSYARIHMIPYKLNSGTVYTDTDSIFTTEKLPDDNISNELGAMKDELNGLVIDEGYFLGIKQYGYHYTDLDGIKHDKSTFAGITRNSLKFEEVKSIFNGETITKEIPIRFYKSFTDLSINVKSTKVSIKLNRNKRLVNNNYIPISILETNKSKSAQYNLFIKLKHKILKMLKLILRITKR